MRQLVLTVLAVGLTACSDSGPSKNTSVYNMGDLVTVGKLKYTVVDTEWIDQLGDAANPKLPQHRFLSIRLNITNSGSSPTGVPTLVLNNAKGESFQELTNAEGLRDWLGYLRTIQPAQTERGRVAFDVPTGAYRLRLADDSDPENEKVALVDIPVQLAPAH